MSSIDELRHPSAVKTFADREGAEPETIPLIGNEKFVEKWENPYRQTWRVARPRSREDIMLDCRFSDGSRHALAYFHLGGILFDGTTIVLMFGDVTVTVRGKNLDRLYSALAQHRVPFIQESDEKEEKFKPENESHIESIEVGKEKDEVPNVR